MAAAPNAKMFRGGSMVAAPASASSAFYTKVSQP